MFACPKCNTVRDCPPVHGLCPECAIELGFEVPPPPAPLPRRPFILEALVYRDEDGQRDEAVIGARLLEPSLAHACRRLLHNVLRQGCYVRRVRQVN
jgi:hypothetical protein